MKRLLALVLLLVYPSIALADKRYVGKDGNDGNAGTIVAPWLTIVYSETQTRTPGDTLVVWPGPGANREYDEVQGTTVDWCDFDYLAGTLFIQGSGTQAAPIVYMKDPDSASPVICGNRGEMDRYAVCALGESWITLDGLTIKQAVRGIYIEGGSSDSAVITAGDTSGVPEGWLIKNSVVCSTFLGPEPNHVDNNGGILIAYCGWIKNIRAENNTAFAIGYKIGSYPSYTFGYNSNDYCIVIYRYIPPCIIRGNTLWHSYGGLRLKTGLAAGALCDSNYIYDHVGDGINGLGWDAGEISFNRIRDIDGKAIMIEARNDGAPQGNVTGVVIRQNSIYRSGESAIQLIGNQDGTQPGGTNGGWQDSGQVYNNLCDNANGSSRDYAHLLVEDGTCPPAAEEICGQYTNYNCWWDGGNSTTHRLYTPTAVDYTLAQVQANTTYEDNSIYANPQMVDPANGDFSLAPTSPCIGTGRFGLDIGAVQYTEDEPPPTLPKVKRRAP